MLKRCPFVMLIALLFISCKDGGQTISNAPQNTAHEQRIQSIFTESVVRKNYPMDSLHKGFVLMDSLTSGKDQLNGMKEIIRGNYYRRKASYHLAKSYYTNALSYLKASDSLADYAFVGLGISHKHTGNFPEALLYFQKSISSNAERKDSIRLAGSYASLAQLYFEKDDIKKSKAAIKSVFEILNGREDEIPYLIALHTLANVEAKSGNFKEAMEIDRKGIAITEKIQNDAARITFQDNLARCYLHYLKDFQKANFYFFENLKIDKKLNNPAWIADTYINLAEVATEEKKFNVAENYLHDAIKIFNESRQLNNALKGYQALAVLYEKQHRHSDALDAKNKYIEIYKQFINEKSEQSLAEYQTLFETEKKKKELADANLEIAEHKLISRQKDIWLIALAGAIAAGIGIFRYQYVKTRLTRKKLRLENDLLKEQAHSQMQAQRLEISRDLHDSLGAQLTFINSILDGLKSSSAKLDDIVNSKINTLADFSENSMTELRNTLWVLNAREINLTDLKAKILNYINHAAEAKDNVRFHFNFEMTNDFQINSKQAINLFRVVQEIINNALKYASAKDIKIQVSQNENALGIEISDNGIGFNLEEAQSKSYGLANIQNRIAEINGKLNIETGKGKGTIYKIETIL